MKTMLLTFALLISAGAFSQCSIQVNDSLLSPSFDLSLSGVNETGVAPFTYVWTITDGNGQLIPFIPTSSPDSVVINQSTLSSAYGCIIYSLCILDAAGCTSCATDTGVVEVPFPCFSQFYSTLIAENQIQLTLLNPMPSFIVTGINFSWSNGDGTTGTTYAPAIGAPTLVNYIPGALNTTGQVFVCAQINTINGGCIFCDSVPYTAASLTDLTTQGFEIYPNPSDGKFNIKSSSKISLIELIDLNGKILESIAFNDLKKDLDFSALQNGLYILRVTSENNTSSQRIVVSH